MSKKAKMVVGAAIVLITLQLFQPQRNESDEPSASQMERIYAVPKNVKGILSRSCYDCHSDHTRYPWYSRIQPGAWYMAAHIEKGKEALNFSNFGEYSLRRQRNKFRAMAGQIKDGEMPLAAYTLIHGDATLSKQDKQVLIKWFEAMEDSTK